MNTIIKQWVLNKLGLSVPEHQEDLSKGLSNGYLLGEILRKYGIISDDQMIALAKNPSENSRLRNMKYVHRWMIEHAGLNVNFDELLDIKEEKPGATINFMYKLYFHLEGTTLNTKIEPTAGPVIKIKAPFSELQSKSKKRDQIPCQATCLQVHDQISQSGPSAGKPKLEQVVPVKCQETGQYQPLCTCDQCNALRVSSRKQKSKPPCVDTTKYFTRLPCERPKPEVCPKAPEPPAKKTISLESRVVEKVKDCPTFFEETTFPLKGDKLEATNLYFANSAVLHIKKANRELAKVRKRFNSSKQKPIQPPSSDAFKLNATSSRGLREQKTFEQMKAKVQAEFRLAKEMEDYDGNIQPPTDFNTFFSNAPNGGPDGSQQEEKSTPIMTDFQSLKLRMEQLKFDRKQKTENAAERARFRKALSAKMINEIPSQIYNDLMDNCMKKAMKICGRESELADFMVTAHREKTLFYEHQQLEENALQRLKYNQQDNLALHLERRKELEAEIDVRAAQLSERIANKTLRVKLKAIRLADTEIVLEILDSILDYIGKICEYRAEKRTDPPEDMLQEWKALIVPPEEILDSPEELIAEVLVDGIKSDSPLEQKQTAEFLSNEEEHTNSSPTEEEQQQISSENDHYSSPLSSLEKEKHHHHHHQKSKHKMSKTRMF